MIRLTVPAIGNEEIEACARVLKGGQLVHGEECLLFEQELAAYLGVKEAVVVSSGTAALHLALLALGIGPGDAVLVPDFTFPATANVVELIGARPVFVDVEQGTYNISIDALKETIQSWNGAETLKAIMPVHEFGCPADMAALKELACRYDLHIVEDAACAIGAAFEDRKIGSFGDCACFSFHPRKTLTTGEGGAIVTDDPEVANKLRLLRAHGMMPQKDGIHFMLPGFNYRLTNFQAAMARVQLKKLDGWLEERKGIQAEYRKQLAECPGISLPADIDGHSWQTFMISLDNSINRDEVILALKKDGVETNFGAQCVHYQDYYRDKYPADSEALGRNNAYHLYRQGLALPLYQGLTELEIKYVADALKKYL
jgi:perosamine synthetase